MANKITPKPIKNCLFDADGVLWIGDKVIPGAPETFDRLREMGINVFIITNNPTSTRHQLATKFMGKGFRDISDDMVISAGYVTAQYLVSLGFTDKRRRVFVVGEPGLIQEMRNNGINAIGIDDFPNVPIAQVEIPGDILACVVALDFDLTYRKLAIGNRVVVENDALLIGTNCDNSLPLGAGIFVPDAMPNIAALEVSTGRKAIVLGKPSKLMFEPLRSLLHLNNEETLMVGDRLNTDIQFAKNIKSRGAIVLTGITTREDALSEKPEGRPDFICQSVVDIPDLIARINKEAGL